MEEPKQQPLGDKEVEDARKFAIDRLAYENRVFWTRVSALLVFNSILVAAFAAFYSSSMNTESANNPFFTTLIVCGIIAQAIWPIIAYNSAKPHRYWMNLTEAIDKRQEKEKNAECNTLENRVSSLWGCYLKYFRDSNTPKMLYQRILQDAPVGSITIGILFFVFLALWMAAALTIEIKLWPSIATCAVLLYASLYIFKYRSLNTKDIS